MPAPPPLVSDEHIIALGRLVVAVSKIDILLTDLSAALLGTDILSAITVVHHQQIASKIDSLKALARIHLPDNDADIIVSLLADAKAVADYRNTLVHAAWTVDKLGETYTVRFQARGELKRSRVRVAPAQILAESKRADEIADRLGRLRDRLYETTTQSPHPLQTQTHPQQSRE
jgi:hypothetical protein